MKPRVLLGCAVAVAALGAMWRFGSARRSTFEASPGFPKLAVGETWTAENDADRAAVMRAVRATWPAWPTGKFASPDPEGMSLCVDGPYVVRYERWRTARACLTVERRWWPLR